MKTNNFVQNIIAKYKSQFVPVRDTKLGIYIPTGAIAKAVPWVALVYVVAKTIDKVATTCINYGALETGDYRDSINYNNFKSQFSWLYKPFSNAYNEMQAQNKFRIDDYRKSQQRQLLGDSVINTYTNRGV